MAREWMPEDSATLAACLYVANPYMLFVAYERAAYGELLAAAWMPLLVLFALRAKPAMPGLALVIAGLWLTNAPAAVMGCYALAVLVAVAASRTELGAAWSLIGRAAAGTALGLGLAGFWLVPALYQQRWVEIQRAIGAGMRVEDSFLFGHTGEAFHDQVLRTVSWIAVVLLVTTLAAALLSFRTRKRGFWLPLVALGAIIVSCCSPSAMRPGGMCRRLKFLQFPWRWLLVLSLVLAALAGLAFREGVVTRRVNLLRVGRSSFWSRDACPVSRWFYFWQPCDEEDNVRAQLATFHDGGFQGTDEYTSAPADNDAIQQDLPPVRVSGLRREMKRTARRHRIPSGSRRMPDLQPSEVQIQHWNSEHISATIHSPLASRCSG